MEPIVRCSNIGKKFYIHREHSPYLSIREQIGRVLKNPGLLFQRKEEFWSLKNITFDIFPGESIGIIGKNGAGKSTLLKILSRITPPSEGEVRLEGRVASLLEVGTGFHPELSGRENVFFNGAILGMKRREIRRKFDEIVDFSGVEKFIDTPLKHYSSGMQLRLAFAVAAFLEAEILLVDEVLAVGDAEFQKKCLGKMEDVTRKEGRTVLFVSHNMGAIKHLCGRTILLKNGTKAADGKTDDVVHEYINSNSATQESIIHFNKRNEFIELHSLELTNAQNNSFSVCFDEDIHLKIKFKLLTPLSNIRIGIGVTTIDNYPLFTTRSEAVSIQETNKTIVCDAAIHHNLRAGVYRLMIGISGGNFSYFYLPEVAILEILNFGRISYPENLPGVIYCKSDWKIHSP